jgi:hypothetical protein
LQVNPVMEPMSHLHDGLRMAQAIHFHAHVPAQGARRVVFLWAVSLATWIAMATLLVIALRGPR